MLHCLSRTDVYVMDWWTGMMTRDIPSLVSLKGLAGCEGGCAGQAAAGSSRRV